MERISEMSSRLVFSLTGVCYLITIFSGIFVQGFVSRKLVIFGDAVALIILGLLTLGVKEPRWNKRKETSLTFSLGAEGVL